MGCNAAPVVALQRPTGQTAPASPAQNVSHCMSLSAYLIDAIVICKFPPKRYRIGGGNRDNDVVDIGECALAPASSYWETP